MVSTEIILKYSKLNDMKSGNFNLLTGSDTATIKSAEPSIDLEEIKRKREIKVDYIAGPVSLGEYYSAKYDKHFYIFGDRHARLSNCPKDKKVMPLSDFFKLVTEQNVQKIIDIFLESEYIDKYTKDYKLTWEGAYFQEVFQAFESCLKLDKGLCLYKNVRVHYGDIRLYKGTDPLRKKGREAVTEIINKTTKLKAEMKSSEFTQEIIKIEDSHDNLIKGKAMKIESYFDYILKLFDTIAETNEIIMKDTKIQDQLNNIKDKNLVKEIETFFAKKFISDMQKIRKFISNNRLVIKMGLDYKKKEDYDLQLAITHPEVIDITILYLNNLSKKLTNIATEIRHLMTSFMANYMDYYVMARSFRSFTPKLKNPNQYSESPKYIMIYVGDGHAENYRELLMYLGFTERKHVTSFPTSAKKDVIQQCINIKDFKQPFFSS